MYVDKAWNEFHARSNAISSQSVAGALPRTTQQYALPVHRTTIPTQASYNSDISGGQTPRSENTLRRKTPNGTLNAGYDGSSENVNPLKYQLLPVAYSHVSHDEQPSSAHHRRTFVQHQQLQHSGQGPWSSQPGLVWHGSQIPQQFDPIMADSMLTVQPYFGPSIPSVLQPSFQYLGPTASGGQGSGPYGPYWHDGTFVPYRPAAVRDPRFYQHAAEHWQGLPQGSQLTNQGNLYHYGAPAQGQWPQSFAPFQGPISNPSSATGHQPSYDSGYSDAPRISSRQHSQGVGQLGVLPPSDTSGVREAHAEFGATSRNGMQRDRVFAWALQQYRELLSFIHQTRRHQQQQNQQVPQRPSIYPRPPKASAPGGPAFLVKTRADSETSTCVHSSLPPHLTRADYRPAVAEIGQDLRNLPSVRHPIEPPSGVHLQGTEYQRRASHEGYHRQEQPPWPHPQADRLRSLRRSSGSGISPNPSQLPLDDSPASHAAVALSYMTKLCQKAEWQWTDGMHLAGCLAYGLGQYQRALIWYTKVLEMEPKHLEATSNLAATLLVLDRRQEAEQLWMKVVKAAPSYFEAVEHLVGLLCNDQRSQDAAGVIKYIEHALRQPQASELLQMSDGRSECSSSTASRSRSHSEVSDRVRYDFDAESNSSTVDWRDHPSSSEFGFGSSGFAIPGCDNGRILALIHAKGNMLYGLGDNGGAARAFEDAVLIAAGRRFSGIQKLVDHILKMVSNGSEQRQAQRSSQPGSSVEPMLLTPDQALLTAKLCFPQSGELPGLQHLPGGAQSLTRKAAIATTSNSLLSLAKIFQDSMSNPSRAATITPLACGVRDILALYYLSLSLQPSPSTANNVGILLASVQQTATSAHSHPRLEIPGVVPGSGVALALQYYNYGLQLDQQHAHLYTNLGSLLKDIGQLDAAINMYERAVKCDGKFDIALANLANAVKDKGRISDAIAYYRRAVEVNPEFAEAVCGLANALNSVCGWQGRGGIAEGGGTRDRWHVDPNGMLLDAKLPGASSSGWIRRVVDIVQKQLVDGESWGRGVLTSSILEDLVQQMTILGGKPEDVIEREEGLRTTLQSWAGQKWEGARVTRMVERATKRIGWHWYQDLYVRKKQRTPTSYDRPQLPVVLTVPTAPTVLPFHTFTCPLSAKQIRLISQRNGLRISVSTLRSSWLPKQVFSPPRPPSPYLRVGYVSSDFNNHPLAHLMQSVFGLHDRRRVEAYCYATTGSDKSVHRQQIEREAPVFRDASSWSVERLVKQIVQDEIHILVNLNGYTRGARNEVFAARPAPIQMSFMGFAGTLGAEWCDYLLADQTAILPETLRPWRRNVDLEDQMVDENQDSENDDWIYGENIIYCRDTFFCCDHKQSAPDAHEEQIGWEEEQARRWQMRKELFPSITDGTIVFGNFNQLYKIDPTTFRTWLRILARVPNSVLWLLRFPDLGESHLLATARLWAGAEVASRVIFTDVAPKHLHISRARVCDVVLDTAECNAHTTAADVLWSGTPLLTLPRYSYKMCSRMAASILQGALPKTQQGAQAGKDLIATSEEDYEDKAVKLAQSMVYAHGCQGRGTGRLMEVRRILFEARGKSALFDTKRWVRDLEDAYDEAWKRWVAGEGGDIWLGRIPGSRTED